MTPEVARDFEAERLRSVKKRYELPSAGMAFVRLANGGLEYAQLCDCRAILALPDGRVLSTQKPKLNELDERVLRKMALLRSTGEARNRAQARRAVEDDLRGNRDCLNTPGGYWVLSTHPEAAQRMEAAAVPLAPGEAVAGLLVTDGLYRLVDTFEVYPSDSTLLSEARRLGLKALLERLRALEEADSDCASHPRFKQKDDATGLLFQAVAPQRLSDIPAG